jgi:hypothetical protein
MMGIIEHIEKDDLYEAMVNVRSMLTPHGRVVITTQNMDSDVGVHYKYMDLTHELGFNRESMLQLGRLMFERAEVFPWEYPEEKATTLRQKVGRRVRKLYRKLYHLHLTLLGTSRVDNWYSAPGLIGVFHNA